MNLYFKTIIICFSVMLIFSLTIISNTWAKEPAKVISGWVEKIRLKGHDFEIKAKLDTGARTSSINAKNIKSFKKNDQHWVQFTLVLMDNKDNKHEIQIEKPRSRRTNIKNHDGEHDKRHVVDFEICFNGEIYTTEFTLADRREYIYDVLLGRQFLKNIVVIDPSKVFLATAECE